MRKNSPSIILNVVALIAAGQVFVLLLFFPLRLKQQVGYTQESGI